MPERDNLKLQGGAATNTEGEQGIRAERIVIMPMTVERRRKNLQVLRRFRSFEQGQEGVLRTAIAASPRDAGLYYALGLTLTRLKRTDEAMAELRRAAELEPDRARYAYVYAVALHSAGRREQAIAVLKENLTRHPEDRDTLLALVTFSRDAGDLIALEYAERLARLVPGDRDVANLVRSLQSQLQKPDGK